MKARIFIGGSTVVLIAGAILVYSAMVPERCPARAGLSVSDFDPFKSPQGDKLQEPWLDPLVFFSDKAYVVSVSPSGTNALITDAAFIGGNDELVGYLKGNIAPHIAPGIGWLKPPVVHFTLNEHGEATKVELMATSGNVELDARLLEVTKDMPRWIPAKDADGKVICQPFEFRVIQGACDQKPPTAPTRKVSMYDVPLTDRSAALDHPYDLEVSLEKAGGNRYTLTTMMKLHGGSFYISPFSTGDFKGKFHLEVANQGHVVLDDEFTEAPRSKEEIDLHQFVNGPVNWVSVDTKYEHSFTVTSREDFDVGGKYIFTIEPKCTLEQVPFMLKYRAGVLTIEKGK